MLQSGEHVNNSLISAVRDGRLETARMLINNYGLSYSEAGGYVLLCNALKNNHVAVAKLLLTSGSKVNIKSKNPSGTPLHFAVINGDVEIVNMLVDKGAYINAINQSGRTPLQNVIKNRKMKGSEEVVNLLLRRGANVDVKGKDNITPLHIAAKKGYTSIAEDLLNHGACIHSLTLNEGYTPLHFASELGNEETVKLLLDRGADINASTKGNLTPLYIATKNGHKPVVNLLLQRGAKVDNQDKYGKTILHLAVEKGYLKIIGDLLKYGADVNSTFKGFTPLHSAAKNKQEEVAKLLISYKANINAQDKAGKTPIFYAIESADLKITKLLLTSKANIKDSPELLNIAVEKKCIEIVQALLQHGADINASDNYGRTALHFTALRNSDCFLQILTNRHCMDWGGHLRGKIAKLLVSKGANVDAQTKNGVTTLQAAIHKGYSKLVKALLECNANVNSTVIISLLHLSTRRGNKEIIIMLLNKGANVNAKEKDGITPLHIATQEGHEEIVKVLLEYGAKVDSKTNNNITPLHLGAKNGFPEIIETLLKFGADINITSGNKRTPLNHAMDGLHLFYKNLKYDDDEDFYHHPHTNPHSGAYKYEVTVELLKHHIVKMKTANLYVSEENLRSMTTSDKISDFQDKCEEEIAHMKSEKINNPNISFYDILVKDRSSLAILTMRNENIVQVLKSNDYKTKFPIYAIMIENNFRKGMERKELLEQDKQIFHFLFNKFPECPNHCIEQIFSYLSDKDLRILIEACKPLSISNPNTNVNDVVID